MLLQLIKPLIKDSKIEESNTMLLIRNKDRASLQ